MMEMVEINGIKYEKLPHKETKLKTMGLMLCAFAMFYQPTNMVENITEPKIDIEKEFGLIQLKKSNLSRSKREYVVATFERKYRKI